MSGTLYALGVGPGDPELLTLKAARILKSVATIFVPKGKAEGKSLALSIIENVVDLSEKKIVEALFPMRKTKEKRFEAQLAKRWDEIAGELLGELKKGKDLAFITLGDPTLYSTFFYLYERLIKADPAVMIEIVPAVSSVTAASASAGMALGLADDSIAILPATYIINIKEIVARFNTIVLIKVYKVFDELLAALQELGLASRAVCVSRASMRGEAICKDILEVKGEDLDYFSLVIIRRG